jgi:hypothetical protein
MVKNQARTADAGTCKAMVVEISQNEAHELAGKAFGADSGRRRSVRRHLSQHYRPPHRSAAAATCSRRGASMC